MPTSSAVAAVSKRLLTVPFILAVGVCNVLYGVYISLSHDPTLSSSSSLRGLSELLHQRDQRGAAMKHFLQEQAGSQQLNAGESGRILHPWHKPGLPSLILHVGPQYTFASELQVELQNMAFELANDKYDIFYSSDDVDQHRSLAAMVTDMRCHHSLTRARKRYDSQPKGTAQAQSLKEYLSDIRCWKRALAELEVHRSEGHSVVVSDESISTRWYHSSHGLGLTSLDWIALEETLGDSWNIEIVVGYRRYAEWLPAAVRGAAEWRHQAVLADGMPPLKRVEPKSSSRDTMILPLFPDLVESAVATGEAVAPATLLNATYTATVIARYLYRDSSLTARIPVTLLNVHLDQSLGTTFSCHILYDAPTACRASKKRTAALSREFDEMNYKLDHVPAQAQDFYEILASYCASKNMYRADQYSVQDAMISIRYYQEEMVRDEASDLAVICPTPEQSQVLLSISLKHELNLLPDFAISHNGNDEHRHDFRYTVEETHKLCGIDVVKAMNDPGMNGFVQSLPHGVPAEYLSVVTKPPTRPPTRPTRPPTSPPHALTKENDPESVVSYEHHNKKAKMIVYVDQKATGKVVTFRQAGFNQLHASPRHKHK